MGNIPKIEVAIIDDHQLFRNGLKFIIENENDMEVSIEASNGKQFLSYLPNLQPEVALMDINMPEMYGVETSKNDIDGSQVNEVYYKEKNLERISKYCQRDVMVTAQVFLKLNGFQKIHEENIQYL